MIDSQNEVYVNLFFPVKDTPAPKSPGWRTFRSWKGWRRSILFGAIASFIALLLNVVVLIWASTRHIAADRTIVLYQGSYTKMKHVNTGLHALVTVLSSLLLFGGNASMQVVCAPTRESIQRAHNRGQWLNIGTPGFRTLLGIPLRRKLIWLMLGLTSIPLHLFYNSVVFTRTTATNYLAILVTQGFTSGAPYNLNGANLANDPELNSYVPGMQATIDKLHDESASLIRMDNAKCIETFGTNFVTEYLNVLLVTNISHFSNSLLRGYLHQSSGFESDDANFKNDLGWICDNRQASCDIPGKVKNASDWALTWTDAVPSDVYDEYNTISRPAHVEFCLAEPYVPSCTVLLSIPLLATVAFCNAVEVILIVWVMCMHKFTPLITTGDAIQSFMLERDQTTANHICLSVIDARKGVWPRHKGSHQRVMSSNIKSYRWLRAVSVRRWLITIFACLVVWGLALAILLSGLDYDSGNPNQETFHSLLSAGFGTILPDSLVTFFGSPSTLVLVVVANIPQLLISILYWLYSGIFTIMLLSHEYSSFAISQDKGSRHDSEPKGLRVSTATGPVGAQRSTYFLNLPFRYGIPLMIGSTGLHFFASQSIFLAEVTEISFDGSVDPQFWIQACGWSAFSVVIVLVIGGIMILILVASGVFRKFHSGIPLASTCSVAISSACHGLPLTSNAAVDEDAPKRRLAYGVLGEDGVGKENIGFGYGRVRPLRPRLPYMSRPLLDTLDAI